MTKDDFGLLDVSQQEELVQKYGEFVHTKIIGQHLCDVYMYDTFYVLFYYLLDDVGIVKSHCFNSVNNIEFYINSIEGPK